MIGLQVSDGWLDSLASAQPAFLLRRERFELAPVDDLHIGVVGVHTAESQVDHDLFELDRMVLKQIRRLLQRCVQDVAIVRVTGECARAQHQAVPV